MGTVAAQALSQLADLRARSHAEVHLPKQWPQALGYAPWVGEVWVNLLSKRQHGGSPPSSNWVESPTVQIRFWGGTPASRCRRAAPACSFRSRARTRSARPATVGLVTVQRRSKLGGTVEARPPRRRQRAQLHLPRGARRVRTEGSKAGA
jgi:hypothetical protein